MEREWDTYFLNFDNFYQAFGTLTSVLTLEDVPVIYRHAMDSTTAGWGPEQDNKREAILYFILFIFGIAVLFLNIIMASKPQV